jgi:MinD-like ATPase involved in chromosome partitioning or flagellar assembly
MHVVAMYSFKGGAGRTTATANIASALALLGKRVICVDFDIEGPGLRIVFRLNPEGTDHYVQDFLNAPNAYSFPLREAILDVHELSPSEGLQAKQLWVFPSSQDFKKRLPEHYNIQQVQQRLEFLKTWTKEHLKPDVMFIDCPSGWGPLSKACVASSDHVCVFFRMSLQHLLGTLTIARLFSFTGWEFSLIPSAVPEGLRRETDRLEGFLQTLEDQFPRRTLNFLPEVDRLKWDESALLLDADFMREYREQRVRSDDEDIIARYQDIAERIAGYAEGRDPRAPEVRAAKAGEV